VPRLLRMPGVSAGAEEAVLSEWLIEESAEFGSADAIATVETDKALVDVEADAAGVMLTTLVPAGVQVEVGAPIAVLVDPGEQVGDLESVLAELGVADGASSPAPTTPKRRDVPDTQGDDAAPAPVASTPPVDPESSAPVATAARSTPRRAGQRIFASPLARRLAKDASLPIEEIPGTGPRDRVLGRDVRRALAAREAAPNAEPARDSAASSGPAGPRIVAAPGEAAYDEVPHTRFRRSVAQRLTDSKQHAPHFYLRATVRAERLLALRAELNDGADVRVSVNDLVVRAVAVVHRREPELNVTWTDDGLRVWRRADVAVAVATERGLVTPVVRDVGSRTITELAQVSRDLAERARAGRLRQEELEGGSIAVTNLGMYGVEEFAAIINPPHAAILAVGAVRDEPVVDEGAVVPGQVMTLTLSVDHRPVDGVIAARWLAALTDLLEHPTRVLA
jgi:pyruvate dehydrogenase E2 component (dihydrolipoamide acetyltransferase)